MALRYWVGGTANWDATAGTKWALTSGGAGGQAVPTSADDVFLDAASGVNTVTISATAAAKSLDCTGFTGTLAGSSGLSVSGSITLATGMTQNWTGTLSINAASTITSNGKSITAILFNATATINISGVLNVTNVNYTASLATIVNGSTINISGTLSTNTNTGSGSALLNMIGTGTLGVAALTNSITINTTGTITTVALAFGGGTFTYIPNTGTFIPAATCTFVNCTINSSGISWTGINLSGNITLTSAITITGTLTLGSATTTITGAGYLTTCATLTTSGTFTYTLANNLTVTGDFIVAAQATFAGTYSIFINGNLTVNAARYVSSTTATLVLDTASTATWSHASGGYIGANLIINKPSGTLILSTNVYYRTGTLTYTAGTVDTTTNNNTINIEASCTLNTSSINWNNVTVTGTTPTITLTSNLNASNLITIGSGANITTITSSGGTRTITCGNGFTNGSTTGNIVCNANIKVTGGTITGSTTIGTITGYLQINNSPYQFEIAGNVTFATATAFYIYGGASNTGKFLYTSGTVTTTGSTIYFNVLLINSGSIDFNNVWFVTGGGTFTLQSDVIVNGLLTLGYLDRTYNINNDGSTRTIIASNGISMSGTTGVVTGSANIRCTGGTITGISTVTLRNNLEIAGNVTFANGVTFYYSTGILKYTSGNITTTNSTLSIIDSSAILNTNGIIWNNIICANYSLSLISNLTCQNFSLGSIVINNNGGNVFILGNLTVTGNNSIKGTAVINLIGTGVWSGALYLGHDLTFNMGLSGVITILGNVYFGYFSGTFTNTYKSGIIKISGIGGLSGNQFVIYGTQTFIDFHKVPLTNILIISAASPTFNQFFTGTPTKPCLIYTNLNTQNYIINFTDGFERIAKFVNITGCTLGKPQQLIVITAKKIVNNTAYTTLGAPNVGIRYINQSPNGIAKNKPTLTQTTYGTQMLLNDPGMK